MVHSELFATVLSTFETNGWNYSEVSGREVIRAGFEAHHTRVNLHVQVFEPLAAISVVAESPNQVTDPAKRERLVELIMRVNKTLTVGNFELDWDTGQLMFRATNLFATPQGEPSIIQGLVHNAVGEMDRIAPMESIVLAAEGAELASLKIEDLLQRQDLLPEIPSSESDPQ
ncbi:MAG: hypothetical protein HRU46_14615 [Verrucomicrobiales bacterium]|nr:hypothetical protein [Verrucomicrobiales bacterium]